jgi:arylsulfatase A-like enzyme
MKKIFAPLAALLLLFGCGGGDTVTMTRLVDVFDPASVEGAPDSPEPAPQALWDFSQTGDDPTLGWKAGPGVEDLRVVDGKLTGRATTDFPVIYAAKPSTVDTADVFHSIEVSAMASGGAEIRAHLSNADKLTFDNLLEVSGNNWRMEGRVNGDNLQSVTFSDPNTPGLANLKNILLRPASTAGSTFEIASIRMLAKREHLALIPSGIGFNGLGEIYRESIVSRSPESFTLSVDVPANSWLDLNVGTVEDGPVTFVVTDVTGGADTTLVEKTVTTKDRWDLAPVDLAGVTGTRQLKFSLNVEGDRKLGYWGSPAIRTRGARPAAVQAAQGIGSPEAPQGVILIMIDTLRKDHMSLYGYERDTTPTLVKMADEGTLFLDNITQATWTKVSTPSIMTSLYPQSHRVFDAPNRLPAAAHTIAEVYREGGYATASFCSNGFTGRATNLHQGYEEVHEAGSLNLQGSTKSSRPVVDGASDWLERHKDSPFFMYLHFYDPHSNFEPRPPYNTMWADAAGKTEHEEQRKKALDYAKSKGETRQFNHLPEPGDLSSTGTDPKAWMDYEMGWYDGSIRGFDAEIARLLERLRTLGIADKTQIAFITDHGEELHDHGKMGHGFDAYGEITNVTMMLYRPGVIPAGVKVAATTRSIDLMPTLLNLSGLPVPEQAQGRSLLPLIAAYRDAAGDEAMAKATELGWEIRPAVTEEHKRNLKDDKDDESFAIVFDGWKLINNTVTKSKPEFELFDHAADPLDRKNVAEANPETIEKLKTELSYWRREVTDAALPEDSSEGMSSEELQKLRSLGYIQ